MGPLVVDVAPHGPQGSAPAPALLRTPQTGLAAGPMLWSVFRHDHAHMGALVASGGCGHHTPIGRVGKLASPRGWAALTCLSLELLVLHTVFWGHCVRILLNLGVLSTWP